MKKTVSLYLLIVLVLAINSTSYATSSNNAANTTHNKEGHSAGIHVASWRWTYVKVPFLLTAFVVAVALTKIVWHRAHVLSELIPESCMLIILGLAIGCIFLATGSNHDATSHFLLFDSRTFFLFLLPPIILESSYSLRDRAFFENIGTIMLYAVVGTIMNVALVGVVLIGLYQVDAFGSLSLTALDCLLFSSLICAVDPVAVLAIFQEVGVNKMLYYMVFGESLLNDAVTVVMYTLMVSFAELTSVGIEIEARDIVLGFASFLCVSLGGFIIGVLCGLLCAFITKYTSEIRVVEPTIVFGMAYLAYLLAELVHFSGIISIIACGLVQAQYAFDNISSKSYICVHYFSKVASSVTESVIFIILGVMLVNNTDYWQGWSTTFSVYSLLAVVLVRFLVVFLLTSMANFVEKGLRVVSFHEQLIMAYGGLRGAVSFSLVFALDPSLIGLHTKNVMMSATYLIILFTVFVQGSTIKPLVKWLRIALHDKRSGAPVFQDLNRYLVEHLDAGIEEIISYHGEHYITEGIKYLSHHFLRPALQIRPHRRGMRMVKTATQLEMQQKLDPTDRESMYRRESMFRQVSDLEDSELPESFGRDVMDLEEFQAIKPEITQKTPQKEKHKTSFFTFEKKEDFLEFKNILSDHYYKNRHYYAYDRNLSARRSQNRWKAISHLGSIRRAFRRPGALQPSVLRSAMLSASIGLPNIPEECQEDNSLDDASSNSSRSSAKPTNGAKKQKIPVVKVEQIA